jgi:hypothetical protein
VDSEKNPHKLDSHPEKALSLYKDTRSQMELKEQTKKNFFASIVSSVSKSLWIYTKILLVPMHLKLFQENLRKSQNSKQIFNVEKTELYWKQMPSRTCILEKEKAPLVLWH